MPARRTYAIVRFTVPGFHHWPGAPDHRDYLGKTHRHLFHVELAVEVRHDDREIEFHDLLDFGQDHFSLAGPMSCEMAAEDLLVRVEGRWPGRNSYCEVFEDGECGAAVYHDVEPDLEGERR